MTSFRLIHTSDWHIGQELHGHSREYEHDTFLAWLLDQLEERAADGLVVTGDIYDVANPPIGAMRRLYGFLADALERLPNLKIVITGGNHDSAARINLPGALLRGDRIHLVGALPRCDAGIDYDQLIVPLHSQNGETSIWVAAVPYCRPGDLGQGDMASLYDEVLNEGTARAGGAPLVVTGHLHVAGGEESSDSERRIVIGGEEAQASNLFDQRAAYVALGHLHRPQAILGGPPICYAGSPFPMSATEREYRHSIVVVDLALDGTTVETVAIPRPVQFLVVPASGSATVQEVEQALANLDLPEEPDRNRQPFIEVAVRLEAPEPGLHHRINAALEGKDCRLTRVRREFPTLADAPDSSSLTAVQLDELSPQAIFAGMYRQRFSTTPPADLNQAFAELLLGTEAGEPE